MSESVDELVEMARALSEGDCERKLQQEFGGELGRLASYLEAVRQTLRSVYSHADQSSGIIPQASGSVAEIYEHAEKGVNSILEVVDEMSLAQEEAAVLLGDHSAGLDRDGVRKLKEFTDSTRQGLMSLIGYLSFQDVLRQRVEKVQGLIEELEQQTLELVVKFKGGGGASESPHRTGDEPERADASLDQDLVDKLMESLR